MLTKSLKTSEFWLVLAAMLYAVLFPDGSLDLSAVQDLAQPVSGAVAEVRAQIHGIEATRGTAQYWLAFAWMIYRGTLKIAAVLKGAGNEAA